MSGGAGGGKTFTDAADSVITFLERCGEADIEAGFGFVFSAPDSEQAVAIKAGITAAIERHMGTVIVSYEEPRPVAQGAKPCGAFDLIRLGARAMRRAAEADCGNHSESVQEDAMTSGGLSPADRMKLAAHADAADEIRKQISGTCEDSALGYLSYMGSDEDISALKSLGVTSDWLYRRENGVPSRAEIAKAEASSVPSAERGCTCHPYIRDTYGHDKSCPFSSTEPRSR